MQNNAANIKSSSKIVSIKSIEGEVKHPDHTSALARLRKIKGQINGLEKMIHEKRYCVDILTQFRAVASGLNVIESSILERHIQSCVVDVARSKNESEIQRKVAELTKLISNRL
ncbi:MAG: metal-sensitive transcriptional regulator [Bdellovibrionales bacterium]|nr:metal-sensitive transcriptional regulator [Bdellovibrionales bacterium]